MSLIAVMAHAFTSGNNQGHWQHYTSWQLLGYHPLYNVFSMVTLGFCSALTHSLLNAGKRVYAIIIAILWFQEGFSFSTVVGLVAVAMGGMWYTLESKRTTPSKGIAGKRWSKPLAAVAILATMYQLQRLPYEKSG